MRKLIFIVYGGLISLLSLTQIELLDLTFAYHDKIEHFVAYSVFTLLAYFCTQSRQWVTALCIAIIAYGGVLEILQASSTGRIASIADFCTNVLGVMGGVLIIKLYRTNTSYVNR
ncbi:VanZ family protein [Photobacterium kagoshimensis]|uniref:VanZ family protein n=1 Tax=Photobacterium kagoshimensis TaxID=2910242 RepID=UPI003D150BA2